MTTFHNKINSIAEGTFRAPELIFSEDLIVNPLGGANAREFVPLWLQLLPENSEEVRLPEEVKDAVYSPEGEVYPSIDFDPRAGFFERADAHSAALAERLGSMSFQHYSAYEAASLSNDEDEFLSKLDASDASSASSAAPSPSPAGEPSTSGTAQ